jgi:DNA-binding transcriptional LysR family regulator
MERNGLWGRMALFTHIIEAGSLTAASDQLGLSKSSISQQISMLEATLGVRLLVRSKSGIAPTVPGERLYEHSKRLLREVDNVIADVRQDESTLSGILRVSVPAGSIDDLVVPVLGAFLKQHPNLRLDVVATDSLLDLQRDGIDVAFRFGWIRDGSFIARKIAEFDEVLCASPDYIAQHGPITSPGDLERHAWVGYSGFGAGTQTIDLLNGKDRRQIVNLECRLRTSHAPSQKAWALAGVGITRLPRFLVEQELASGALVTVLDDYHTEAPSLYVVYAADRYRPTRVEALISFSIKALSKSTSPREAR